MSKQTESSRICTIGFSIVGSLLIISLFAFINFSTGCKFPWFIYPSFAVIWWPLGVIFAGRHSMKVFSLIGSLAIIAFFVITNYITSWSYPWFLYPSFAIIWWPLAMFLGARNPKFFSVIGSIAVIVFAMITNYINSPSYIWFFYPAFAVIWWPLSIFLARPKTIKIYSIFGSLLILAFLTADNLVHSPFCPWTLFAVYPVLLWPALVLLGRRALKLPMAIGLCAGGIAYYAILNLLVFTGFPWVIFPTYLLLWWPLSIALAKRGYALPFSLCGTLLSMAFFITLNLITTPQCIWAVYPIFALIWWPLSTYYFVYKRRNAAEPQK